LGLTPAIWGKTKTLDVLRLINDNGINDINQNVPL